MEDSASLHTALVLAASHWISIGGMASLVAPAYYYHKSEGIRIINERLADAARATHDTTLGAIASLAIDEVGISIPKWKNCEA